MVEQFNKLPVTVVNGQPVYLGRRRARARWLSAVQTNIVHVNGKRATYGAAQALERVDACGGRCALNRSIDVQTVYYGCEFFAICAPVS